MLLIPSLDVWARCFPRLIISLLCLCFLMNLFGSFWSLDNDEKHDQNTPSFGTDWRALRSMLSDLQFWCPDHHFSLFTYIVILATKWRYSYTNQDYYILSVDLWWKTFGLIGCYAALCQATRDSFCCAMPSQSQTARSCPGSESDEGG